jgi:hypothetical protein
MRPDGSMRTIQMALIVAVLVSTATILSSQSKSSPESAMKWRELFNGTFRNIRVRQIR